MDDAALLAPCTCRSGATASPLEASAVLPMVSQAAATAFAVQQAVRLPEIPDTIGPASLT
ncbi:MAG: hypothetical protein ACLPKE_02095 [Streptosporangiaceae bacterium]